MEGLRLILVVLGLLVIAGVYAYSRWNAASGRQRHSGQSPFDGIEPEMNARDFEDDVPGDLPSLRATEPDDDDNEHAAGTGSMPARHSEKIIVLNILPVTADDAFPGGDLLDVFDRAGLEYGQYDIFHRMQDTADGPRSVFSVASATEPGSFDITTMADESFRGLSLFMLLPGPMRGVDAFADMLATARRIAEQVRGEVMDHDRSTLTRQTARHIREEIIAFEHRLTLDT